MDMAPVVPNQKRKRGRPSVASKTKESASRRVPGDAIADNDEESQLRPQTKQTATEEVMDNGLGPKKRGRPRKSLDSPLQENVPPAKKQAQEQPKTVENGERSNPRKRGRPGKSQDKETERDDAPVETRPPKRLRPVAGPPTERPNDGLQDIPTANGTNIPPVKRGKKAAKGPIQTEDELDDTSTASKTNKSTTKSGTKPSQVFDQPDDGPQDTSATKKTNKPASKSGKKAAQVPDQAGDQNPTETPVRRSTRDRRSADSNPYWAQNTSTNSPDTTRVGRGEHPSLGEVSVAEAQNKTATEVVNQPGKKRGPGRPSLESNAEATSSKHAGSKSRKEADQAKRTTEKAKGKDAHRKSDEAPQADASKGNPSKAGVAKKPSQASAPSRKRRSGPRASDGDEPSNQEQTDAPPAPPTAVPKYRHLTSRTRQIPRSTIAAKWTPLDEASKSAVSSLISEAKLPVLLRLRGKETGYQHADTILNAFSRRLQSKLDKGFPFPPPSSGAGKGAGGMHETELDFEKTMSMIQGLEKSLDPVLHSVALLTREKEKEEAKLEEEYRLLRRLKGNLRDEKRVWGERGRRDHLLVPEMRGGGSDGNGNGEVEDGYVVVDGLEIVKRGGEGVEGVFKDIPEDDEELTALSKQLSGHMNSLRSNLKQIDGVLPAIRRTKGSLQGVLHGLLDLEQYHEVLLGKE